MAHQPNPPAPEEEACLGKRTEKELSPLDDKEHQNDEGRFGVKDVQNKKHQAIIAEVSKPVEKDEQATLDPFLARANFYVQQFIEDFGAEAYYKMMREAYLTQPLEEWPSSP